MTAAKSKDTFGNWCQPLFGAGYRLIPIARRSKVPRDKGWQANTYPIADIAHWLEVGGNVGVLLAEDDFVLDIDPRHGGDESVARLQSDFDIDLSQAPTVVSGRGDGGKHLYFKKPAGLRVRKAVEGYPGIDIKTQGGFVLAPGSRHPETDGIYRSDPAAPGIDQVSETPRALLDVLRRSAVSKRSMFGGGELSVEQLEMVLSVLDPVNYRDYSLWFRIAAASHDATNGDGLDAWLAWAARDDHYGSEADDQKNTGTWTSLTAGNAGGITYLYLLNEVARAGRIDLVLQMEPAFVLDDHRKVAPDFSVSRKPIDTSAFNPLGGKS